MRSEGGDSRHDSVRENVQDRRKVALTVKGQESAHRSERIEAGGSRFLGTSSQGSQDTSLVLTARCGRENHISSLRCLQGKFAIIRARIAGREQTWKVSVGS